MNAQSSHDARASADSGEMKVVDASHAAITEEGIASLRARLGSYYRMGPTLLRVSAEDIKICAEGNGDINPLYNHEDYASQTRYGSLVAPPTFLDQIKHYTATAIGGLPGVHAFHAGNDIEFYRAVRPGDIITPTYRPNRLGEKEGRFAGRMVLLDMEILYRNQRDELVGKAHGHVLRVVRSEARQRGKYEEVRKRPYSDEELENIWRAYDQEEVRGKQHRFWEDVNIGDALPRIVRGPLRITEIAWRSPGGGGVTGGAGASVAGSHYYQFAEYLKRAGYAETDGQTGVPDHPHRGHWEADFARHIGVPGAYDAAVQRTAWMTVLVTNWVGDGGWLKRIQNEFRLFNVEGDTSWVTGHVTKKWVAGNEHLVEIKVECTNQKNEVTTPGSAIAVLPSRNPGASVPM